jgi:hypothetical protein
MSCLSYLCILPYTHYSVYIGFLRKKRLHGHNGSRKSRNSSHKAVTVRLQTPNAVTFFRRFAGPLRASTVGRWRLRGL